MYICTAKELDAGVEEIRLCKKNGPDEGKQNVTCSDLLHKSMNKGVNQC